PYLPRAPGPQEHPTPSNARSTRSSGQSFEQLRRECLQKGVLFEDPDFPATDSSLFYSERPQIPFVWKRPGEIVEDPAFILGGATRTDICQGELGDCWLLAAIAALTLNEKALARVVPQDQRFGPGYAGIFHFQFWQHSEWLDVVVDDRLPTFRDRLIFLHSADHNEFWSALLEKAYAKLNGSYEALKGGSAIEAMEDFTGGVAETFATKEAPQNFYEILEKALQRGSLVGCSIDIKNSAESEARTPFGLIKGHAYTVTGIDQVHVRGRKTELIRVRNPWGQVEWNGAWSDRMAFSDFKAHFDKVEICNLTPDALEEDAPHKWEVTVHQGSWVRGSTAGGCRNFLDTFWTNPQIRLSLTEKDDGQEACTLLVALMQKDRRKLKRFGANVLTIGYAIYQCPGQEDHLDKDFFRYHASQARSKSFINLREVSDRFQLPPGDYILIPSTFEPHQEADFCLRIFSDKKAISRGNTLVFSFTRSAQTSGNGKLEFDEFKVFWEKLKTWTNLFLRFDADKSGTMSSYELRTALRAAGFQLSRHLLQLVVLRYADQDLQLGFDDFLNCLVRLENASRVFQALSTKNKEFIHLNINEVRPRQASRSGTQPGPGPRSTRSINVCMMACEGSAFSFGAKQQRTWLLCVGPVHLAVHRIVATALRATGE
ncbi:Calpain-9, partial [Myotis davidii]